MDIHIHSGKRKLERPPIRYKRPCWCGYFHPRWLLTHLSGAWSYVIKVSKHHWRWVYFQTIVWLTGLTIVRKSFCWVGLFHQEENCHVYQDTRRRGQDWRIIFITQEMVIVCGSGAGGGVSSINPCKEVFIKIEGKKVTCLCKNTPPHLPPNPSTTFSIFIFGESFFCQKREL